MSTAILVVYLILAAHNKLQIIGILRVCPQIIAILRVCPLCQFELEFMSGKCTLQSFVLLHS